MIKEINIDGVFLSPFLGYFVGAAIVWYGLRFFLGKLGAYRFIWHAPLFNTALFVIVLGVFVAAIM